MRKRAASEAAGEDSMMFESQEIEDSAVLEEIKAQIALDEEEEAEEESKEKAIVTWRSKGITADSGIIYI